MATFEYTDSESVSVGPTPESTQLWADPDTNTLYYFYEGSWHPLGSNEDLGTHFGEPFDLTNREYEDDINVQHDNKNFGSGPPTLYQVSDNRAVASWVQSDWDRIDNDPVITQPSHVIALLLEVNDTNITIIDTAKWVVPEPGDPYGYKYTFACEAASYNVQISQSDRIVVHPAYISQYGPWDNSGMTVDDGTLEVKNGDMALAVRIRVSGDSISFVWHRKWGTPFMKPRADMSTAVAMIDTSNNTIVYCFGGGSAFVRIDPNDGHWIKEELISNVYGLPLIQKGNNFMVLAEYSIPGTGQSTTKYHKGTLNPFTFDVQGVIYENKFMGKTIVFDSEDQVAVYDPYDNTYLVVGWLETTPSYNYPDEDYLHFFRVDLDNNGDLVLLNVYVQDTANWSGGTPIPEVPKGNTYGMQGGGGGREGWGNSYPPVPFPDKVLGVVGCGGISSKDIYWSWNGTYNAGLHFVYDLKEFDTTLNYGMGMSTKMGLWATLPVSDEWKKYFWWYDDYKGYNTTSYLLDGINLNGKILVLLNALWDYFEDYDNPTLNVGQMLMLGTVYKLY
jgi:hypothetical protein